MKRWKMPWMVRMKGCRRSNSTFVLMLRRRMSLGSRVSRLITSLWMATWWKVLMWLSSPKDLTLWTRWVKSEIRFHSKIIPLWKAVQVRFCRQKLAKEARKQILTLKNVQLMPTQSKFLRPRHHQPLKRKLLFCCTLRTPKKFNLWHIKICKPNQILICCPSLEISLTKLPLRRKIV
mgnify:CR=1 FL=1